MKTPGMTLEQIINDTDLPTSQKQSLLDLVKEVTELRDFKNDTIEMWALKRKHLFGSENFTEKDKKRYEDLLLKLHLSEEDYYRKRINSLSVIILADEVKNS